MFGYVKRVGAASEVAPGSFGQVGGCNGRVGYLSF